MNQKRSLTALSLLLLLLSWVAWYEESSRHDREKRGQEEALLFKPQWHPNAVSGLLLHHLKDGGGAILLNKDPSGNWMVHKPDPEPANPKSVIKLLTSLHSARLVKVISPDLSRKAEYGLNPPALSAELRFTKGSGLKPVRLSLGHASPVGYGVYLMLEGREEILLGSGQLLMALNRQIWD